MRSLLLDGILHGGDEIDIAQDRAGDPRAAGPASTTDKSARSPEADRDGPTLRDREDRPVAVGRVGDRPIPVVATTASAKRTQRRHDGALEAGLDAHEVSGASRSTIHRHVERKREPPVSSMSRQRASEQVDLA